MGMRSGIASLSRFLWRRARGPALALALAACSHAHQSAQRLIEDVDIAVLAAGPDAVKYAPEELADVEHRLGALQAAYDRGEDRTVLESGRALLLEARGLAGIAATHKSEMRRELDARWTRLAQDVPEELTRLERRLAEVAAPSRPAGKARTAPHGVHAARATGAPELANADLTAARTALTDAQRGWSKAQGAFGNGNLSEAVSTAEELESRLKSLEGELGMAPAAPSAAAAPAAPGH